MEPFALGDLLPIGLATLALLGCLGLFGSRWISLPIAVGMGLRLTITGLRNGGMQALAREFDADYFATGSLGRITSGIGYYPAKGSSRYEQYLSWLREVWGVSVTGLETLGIVVWALSAFFLIKVMRTYLGTEPPAWAMWLYAASPPALLFSNGILRESYECLLVVTALWLFALLHRHFARPNSRGPIIAAGFVLLLGLSIHEAFGIAGAALIGLNEAARATRLPSRPKQILIYVVLAAAAFVVVVKAESVFAEERGRVAGNAGSSNYRTGPIQAGPLSVPADVVVGFALYELAPLPYQVRGPLDLLSFSDTILRVAMFAGFFKVKRTEETVAVALIALAVQLSFSLGTANWGTSLRHHYVSLPAMVILGAYPAAQRRLAAEQAVQRASEGLSTTPDSQPSIGR